MTFKKCLLCESVDIYALKGYELNYLVKCQNCSLVFAQKEPSVKELKDHYATYPRKNFISDITLGRYEELLDGFEKCRSTNNLIDVGCGDGFFLMIAKKRNWSVFGTEYTDEAVQNCVQKGIEMSHSPIDSPKYQSGFFDVITSFVVLEHINTPVAELNSFKKILRSGGLLYITTPNFNSISRTVLGNKGNVIEYPEHLTYYTVKTLKKALRLAGFENIKISTTGISLSRFAKSYGVKHPAGNSDEVLRKRIEKRGFLYVVKIIVNECLNLLRKGDAMKGFFQGSEDIVNFKSD